MTWLKMKRIPIMEIYLRLVIARTARTSIRPYHLVAIYEARDNGSIKFQQMACQFAPAIDCPDNVSCMPESCPRRIPAEDLHKYELIPAWSVNRDKWGQRVYKGADGKVKTQKA